MFFFFLKKLKFILFLYRIVIQIFEKDFELSNVLQTTRQKELTRVDKEVVDTIGFFEMFKKCFFFYERIYKNIHSSFKNGEYFNEFLRPC